MPRPAPVTHGITSKDRPELLARSLTSLEAQTMVPEAVVVVDCSEDPLPTRAVFDDFRRRTRIQQVIYESRPAQGWSRSKGRNRCCELAQTPLVASTETDILFDAVLYEMAMALFEDPPFRRVYAYPWITKLDRAGRRLFEPQDEPGIGYFQLFRRQDWAAIGGYNPLFVNWGHEDSDFSDRLAASGVVRQRIAAVALHMWHPAAYVDNAEKRWFFEHNRLIAERSRWDGARWIEE